MVPKQARILSRRFVRQYEPTRRLSRTLSPLGANLVTLYILRARRNAGLSSHECFQLATILQYIPLSSGSLSRGQQKKRAAGASHEVCLWRLITGTPKLHPAQNILPSLSDIARLSGEVSMAL